MKSFFQLSEQARRHQRSKGLLRENTDQQQNPQAQVTAAVEAAWQNFIKDQNNAKLLQAAQIDASKMKGFADLIKMLQQPAKPAAPAAAAAGQQAPAAAAPAAGQQAPAAAAPAGAAKQGGL